MDNRETGPAFEDVTIGVLGAENFINRISAVARSEVRTPYRLVAAPDDKGEGVREEALRIAENVDVLLFSGPLPYDLATADGPLPVPATFIPTGGVALPIALLRGALGGVLDTARVSIDSVKTQEVREAYSELGVPMRHVHVIEYHESATPEQFLDFHLEHYRAGHTSGAITTVPPLAAKLEAAGVPQLIMAPAPLTMRNALRTARLLGSGARMEDSRIAIVIVRLPASALPNRTSSSNFWFQELKLSLHRTLLHEGRRMDAAVLPRDEQSFLVITTMGSLRTGTDDLQRAPFLANISAALGIDAEVGIGLGRTTVEAEEHAQAAVNLSAEQPGDRAFLIGPSGGPISLTTSGSAETLEPAPVAAQHSKTLRSIVEALDAEGDSNRVVDADRIARLQGVTLRTARRTLHNLVDAGLAWPMPPARQQKVGRPPVRYQLLDERLES